MCAAYKNVKNYNKSNLINWIADLSLQLKTVVNKIFVLPEILNTEYSLLFTMLAICIIFFLSVFIKVVCS